MLAVGLLVPVLLVGPAYGWHDKGHKVVALIAFRQLKPATKDAVVAALKKHVAFTQGDWPTRLEAGSDADASLFTLAAVFPDEVRPDDAQFHELNDPDAHFIDLPYIPVRDDRNDPAIRVKDPNAIQNLPKAFRLHSHDIKSVSVTDEDQATSLSWIFHLVGDVHQPLHSATLYTKVFRTGDRGGNSIRFDSALASRTKQKNLHAYWDGLPGEKHTFADVASKADSLMSAFPKASFTNLGATIDECATESFGLARTVAYNGLADSGKVLSDFPVGYEADAQKTADRQVALAGYRLAEVLEDLYGN
jgi:hypothetical protein